jgi:alpha-amylase
LSKKAITKKQTIAKPKNLNLLNTVPFENGFHFYKEHGNYTGLTANGISEFAEKLQTVPIESIKFHFQRQDFQKWLTNTIGDKELAKRIDQIKAGSQDENLRKELLKTVQSRITELQQQS